jgi:hypothetical protein
LSALRLTARKAPCGLRDPFNAYGAHPVSVNVFFDFADGGKHKVVSSGVT